VTALLLGAVAVTAAACGSNASAQGQPTTTSVTAQGGTLTVGVDQAATGCNPNTAAGATAANQLALAPVLPSAFTISNTGQSVINSALLVGAEVIDIKPQTVVYTINPKAVWSDGVPITAADFIYAWQQQNGGNADAAYPSGNQASILGYSDIASMKASNRGRTVTVVFSTPFADWQMLFANLLPAHVMEKVGWDPACHTVDPAIDVSGGPFKIASVTDGGAVINYAANPRWWGQTPLLDGLVLKTASSPSQLASWLAQGSAQVVLPSSFDASFLDRVSSLRTAQSEVDVSATFLQLAFSQTSPVLDTLGIREAVAHSVDRQALVDQVVGWADLAIVPSASHLYVQNQNAYPGPLPAPLNQWPTTTTTTAPPSATTPAVFPSTADLDAAAKLFTAAGFTRTIEGTWVGADGAPFTVRLVVDTGDAWAATTGDLLVRQLEHAGITVTTTTAPTMAAAGAELAAGGADLALIPTTTSPYPSRTSTWYTPVAGPPGPGGSTDWTNNDDPTLNNIFAQASTELNPVTAVPIYAQADQQLWNTMVSLPLFAEPTVLAWSLATTGITPNPHSPAGLFWLTQTWGVMVSVPISAPSTTVVVGARTS